MPRQNRKFEIGGVYHVINRGVEKRKIFLKDQDYSRFILALEFFNSKESVNIWDMLLRDYSTTPAGSDPAGVVDRELFKDRLNRIRAQLHDSKPIVEILAFTLMPNHYHLILREIQDEGISLFMQKLGGYSTYFNKQNNRVGSLFQGRYKAVQIKDEIQLGNIFSYVHTNPVGLIEPKWKDLQVSNKKKALEYLGKYKWSSYHDYIGNETFPYVIDKEFYLEHFGDKKSCQQAVEDWIKFKSENIDVDKIKLE